MTTLERLGADDLRAVAGAFRDALRVHQHALNHLNVYPVPDGDTGTNMALTMEAVCAELAGLAPDAGLVEVCRAIAHGSLMGARGNSGVILSQILRALADVARTAGDDGVVDGPVLAAGLTAAAEAAYAAVVRPVEGTILTVARGAAEGAQEAASSGGSLLEVTEAGRRSGHDWLARTPQLLAVLAEAGVVDAGGSGFVLVFDALLRVIDGRSLPEAPPVPADVAAQGVGRAAATGLESPDDLRFEVMYLLEAPDEHIGAYKQACAAIGDSIVVVGGDGLWNCHIHTDDVGAAIEVGIDVGRPRQIRVTDLREQVAEEAWVLEGRPAGAGPAGDEPLEASPHAEHDVTTAVVAVAAGAGIRRILYSLGVQQVVHGGQTMNPSTADLLAAVEACPADQVVVLPNNSNVVAVAEGMAAVATKTVVVVPTRSITEGFAALVAYEPDVSAEINAKAMVAASAHHVGGEVTQAVRDAGSEAGPIRVGDWLGVAPDGIAAIDAGMVGAACTLLDHLVGPDHEIVTVIEGEGSTSDATDQIGEWLATHRPHVTVEVHAGGQPLYPYLFGIE